jgi:two-component system nitrate/nitrite response regulator NarL
METMRDTIRVLLVDDHAMVLESLASALHGQDGIEVVGRASDGESALALVAELAPDVVVIDYSMPTKPDGLEVMGAIAAEREGPKTLCLSAHDSFPYARQALDAGAGGYVVKHGPLSELVQAIRAVHRGERFVSPCLVKAVDESKAAPKDRPGVARLSRREFELMRHLGLGRTLQEAAGHMGVVESTASTYRTRMMGKLGLNSTQEIIRFAIENGIVG